MPKTWSWYRGPAIAVATAVTLMVAVGLADRTAINVVVLVASIGLAGFAAYLSKNHPVAAFAILLGLAATSRLTVELPPGTMRLEQPAIAAIGLTLILDRRPTIRRPGRRVAAIIAGLCVYLVALTVSSATQAPHPIESLRFVAWQALSVGGGIAAFFLLRGRANMAEPVFTTAGAISGAIGIAIAVAFLILGPAFDLGIQGIAAGFPRVYAMSWEGNLYASWLGATLPFAIERFRRQPSFSRVIVMILITVGFALALTRGAYLGIAFGLLAQFLGLRWIYASWRSVGPAAALTLLCVIASFPAPYVLLPTERQQVAVVPSPGFPTPTVRPSPNAYPDTIGFRLARVPWALHDLRASPLIGLGADSFGQRHADASQGGAPDHIGILLIALPYESGIIGSAGFGIAVASLAMLLIGALKRRAPLAAAFLGSLVSLLVAYQATNALHLSINWLLAGAALAFALDIVNPDGSRPTEQVARHASSST